MKQIFFVQLFLVSALAFQCWDRQLISSGFPNVITISAEDRGQTIFFSDEPLRRQMGENGKKAIMGEFNAGLFTGNLISIYK